MKNLLSIAARVAEQDEEDDFDPIENIIDEASVFGLSLTREDVKKALRDTGLEADEVSLNQPLLPVGRPLAPGSYTFYKGGETDPDAPGFVTDDPEQAASYGPVNEVIVECTGSSSTVWRFVHDWDGYPQLVPPGPECSRVNEESWLVLKPCTVRPA